MIFSLKQFIYDFFRFAKVLSFRRILNYILILLGYYYSKISSKAKLISDPFSLTFEVSSVCNLNCPQCPVGRNETTRNQTFIDNSFVENTLKTFSKKAFYANLYLQGEPLLNPNLPKLIKKAKELKYYTYVSTNGMLISVEKAALLVDSGLDRLVISIDGITQKSYSFYRKGGELDIVKEGVRKIVAARKQAKKNNPYLIMQFLVNKENEKELKALRKFSKALGFDKLELKTMQVYDSHETYLPQDKRFNRYDNTKLKQQKKACFRLWSHAVFTSDGIAIPCCYDKRPDFSITTDIKNNTFWKSKELMSIRQKVLSGNPLEICKNCNY
jgi:MoaA/NifB/PqqE/SkfB family radical SAM enzyme